MKELKIELKWALIFTLAALAWMYIEKSLGWHDVKISEHYYLTNIFAVVAITVYVLALRDKKINYYEGQMSYRQGFISGVILTLFVALLSPLSQYITSVYISPDYFSNVILYSVSQGEMTQEEAEAYFNLKSYMIQATIGALIMGILTSAIVAFFVKSK